MMPLFLENFETLCLRIVKDAVWHFETLGGGWHTPAVVGFLGSLPNNFTVIKGLIYISDVSMVAGASHSLPNNIVSKQPPADAIDQYRS